MEEIEAKILFTDYFDISKTAIDSYGAFNISLVTDLPLFIDPFLLFNSKKEKYQKLHEDMIEYLRFLKDKSAGQQVDKGLLSSWFRFKEVRQNWLGFSVHNNRGRGLGGDFARALNENLYNIFKDFGDEKITKGSHLERLCLIKDGVGRDNISDFTVNLIKEFLLEYTQEFANKSIDKKYCRNFIIDKVKFNYETESWERREYFLPEFQGDFVLLTPKDILTKDEGWINKTDLIEEFQNIPDAISDQELRSQVNNYFLSALPKKPKDKDRRNAAYKTIQHFPELLDYFIKYKEDNGDKAVDISSQKVKYSEQLYLHQFKSLANLLFEKTSFYDRAGDTYDEAKQRIEYLKDVIENNDGYKIFYVNGAPIKKEDDLQILFRLVWFGTKSDVNREVNNGRGPADFKISRGSQDKTIVEFKLARNKHLKNNLQNQIKIYKKANATQKGLCVIVYFTEEEFLKVRKILNEISSETEVILIDARADNKPSASKAKNNNDIKGSPRKI